MFSKGEAESVVRDMSEWFGVNPKDPAYQAAVLLLLGIGRRKHLSDVTQLTRYPKPFLRTCLRNLKRAGIWKGEDRKTYANWMEQPFSFYLDVLTAVGWLVQVAFRDDAVVPPAPMRLYRVT